jgi:hypothetical protein
MRVSLVFGLALAGCSSRTGGGVAPGDADSDAHDPIPTRSEPCEPIPTWIDADGDGFGGQVPAANLCEPLPPGLAATDDDCDDADPARHPGAFESCNGVDDDCDRATQEGVAIAERDFPSIADALTSAVDGDTIVLCDGTYDVPTLDVVVDLTIASATGDRDAVILEGEGDGSLFVVESTGALTLESITLTGGLGEISTVPVEDEPVTTGGAIHALSGGAVTLRSCVVHGNDADVGGAIAAVDLTIDDSDLFDNEANWGGAVYVVEDGQLTVRNTSVRGNFSWYGGAGVYALGDVVVEGSDIGGNRALGYGGGLSFVNGMVSLGVGTRAPVVDLLSTTFSKNDAYWGGGAVFVQSVTVTADATTELVDNAGFGGGGVFLWCEEGGGSWTGGTFSENTAFLGGAAAVVNYDPDDCVFADVDATSNTALWDGGGVHLVNGAITLSNIVLGGNTAFLGGGLNVAEGAVVTLGGSTVEANVAEEGGGAWVHGAGTLWIDDSIFGTDADDNSPEDVWVGGTSYGDYAVIVHLECEGSAATCE